MVMYMNHDSIGGKKYTMKRILAICILCTLAFGWIAVSPSRAEVTLHEEKKYDPMEVVQALNYCTYSLSKIVSYNDKVVLTFEYDNIINNLNLNAIPDEEIVKLLAKLMDTLKDEIISDRKRERLQRSYQKKMERTFFNLLAGVKVSPSDVVSAAVTAVSSMGSMYVNYQRQLEEYKTENELMIESLDDEKLNSLNVIRKDLLTASWSIIKKYNLDDHYRLTEKQINEFVESVKAGNSDIQHRRLERLLRDNTAFEAFPPFWYHFALSKQNDADFVHSCLDKFLSTHRPIFRKDPLWASVLMEKIRLNETRDHQQVLSDLEEIIRQSHNADWQNFLFAGVTYAQLNKMDEAKDCLQRNIDNGYEVSLNSRILAETLYEGGAQSEFENILKKAITDNRISNSDKLYLIGRCKNVTYLNRFREEIGEIRLIAMNEAGVTEIMSPTYLLTIPIKWLIEDAPFDVRLFNETIDRSHHFESLDDKDLVVSEKKKRVAIKFPEPDHTVARKPEKVLSVNIRHPMIDMTLCYALEKKDIGRAAKTTLEAFIPFYSEVLGTYRLTEVLFMGDRYIFTQKGFTLEQSDGTQDKTTQEKGTQNQ
ncbi:MULTISPECIES: hypothetical protein [Aminobacterium]|uniref:hypothetical protein n=2 Tax=Aminobacterium TaxID=81466 RepID=UPI00257B7CD2|nr:hypothetical protein [Aminobacterium sp. UBA5514]